MRLILFVLCWCQTSYGAFANYNSILIGNQASGMGGAYTALADDSSAVAFYNPGGLGLVQVESASGGATVYRKNDTVYGDLGQFTTASLRVNQGFFRGVPQSWGTVFNLQKVTASLNIVVPDYESFGGEIRSTESSVSLLNLLDESLWVGGAIGKKINQDESGASSLGMTLYYTARNYSRSVRERILRGGSNAVVMSEEKNILSNSLIAIFGYQQSWLTGDEGDEWRFGASFRAPSYQINGSGSYFRSELTTAPFNSTNSNHVNVATLTRVPAKLAFGIAWIKKKRLTIACDLSFYDQEAYGDMTEPGTLRDDIRHKRIGNINIGAEATIRPWLKARVGVFSNFSSHDDPDAAPTYRQGDRVDQVGWSANLAYRPRDRFTFTFGGYYTGGRGLSNQSLDLQLTRVPKAQQVFSMLIGTAFQL